MTSRLSWKMQNFVKRFCIFNFTPALYGYGNGM